MASEKLTEAQRIALIGLSVRHPIAGNDEGWVDTFGVTRRTLNVLLRMGLVEPASREIRAGRWPHRVTPAGRRALSPEGG